MVYESDAQNKLADLLIQEEPETLTASLTDNEMAVVVEVGQYDAAYTADEARELARDMKCCYDQRGWGNEIPSAVSYLRDLADIVDGKKTAEDVKQSWEDRNMDTDQGNRDE